MIIVTNEKNSIDGRSAATRAADVSDPFTRRLVSKYIRRRRSDLDMLGRALSDEDFAAIQLTGHRLYGSGAAYGFEQITAIGEGLEKAAAARQVSVIQALIDDLREFILDFDIA